MSSSELELDDLVSRSPFCELLQAATATSDLGPLFLASSRVTLGQGDISSALTFQSCTVHRVNPAFATRRDEVGFAPAKPGLRQLQ